MLLKIQDVKPNQPVHFIGQNVDGESLNGACLISRVIKPQSPEEIPGSGARVEVIVKNVAGVEFAKTEGLLAPNGFVYFGDDNWLFAATEDEAEGLSLFVVHTEPVVKLAA